MDHEEFDGTVFYSQQVVEKALKALWIKRFNKVAPRVHDLNFLAERLNLSSEFLEICKDLTNIYVEARYPDANTVIPAERFFKEEVYNFLQEVDKILKWIKKNI